MTRIRACTQTCRVFAAILAIALFTPALSAREKKNSREPLPFKYEVRAGWGGLPLDMIYSTDNVLVFPGLFPVSSLYEDYNGATYSTGVISADFAFNFKRWFALSLSLNCNGFYRKTCSSVTGQKTGTERGVIMTFMPHLRFSYLNREYVRLYSSLGVGVTYGTGIESGDGPAVQLVPIGVSAGRKVYGFFEAGAGTMYIGCMAGVGFRF